MPDVGVVTTEFIINRCGQLKNAWSNRARKFIDWYKVLLLNDELPQTGTESVVSNDPRTGFNLARHLLTSMTVADRIPSEDMPAEFLQGLAYLEQFVAKRWLELDKKHRVRGRQGLLDEIISWMLMTGWYSIFTLPTKDELLFEVHSPAESFQNFGPDGLLEHAHIYPLSAVAANRKAKLMGWTLSSPFTSDTTAYDYWTFDAEGDVVNAIILGTIPVKPALKHPELTKLGRLPIFTSPVGGFPDVGSIQTGIPWQEHFGESIVATNEGLTLNYNKIRSFIQQAARYGAQPHWLELSSGDTPIATDELMNRWGSVLHGSPGEEVKPLAAPPIPVELTQMLFHYQQELQRGLFPASVFGNVQQQMSYLAAANAASSAMQTLTPYVNACKSLRSEINNFWTDMFVEGNSKVNNFQTPKNLPDPADRRFDVEASVEIPGYLVQKANVARILNPEFKLPSIWLTERLFPELRDAYKAQANVRAELAMMNPRAIQVDQILAYREQARLFREADPPNTPAAELYEKLAGVLEAELTPQNQGQAQPTLRPRPTPQGLPPEVMPPEVPPEGGA